MWRTPWQPLEDGRVLDCGYREFLVTPAFFEVLLDGGMTHVNGERVGLRVVDRYPAVNAVLVRWTPEDLPALAAGTYAWQQVAA